VNRKEVKKYIDEELYKSKSSPNILKMIISERFSAHKGRNIYAVFIRNPK
jgi:hypothetical protein